MEISVQSKNSRLSTLTAWSLITLLEKHLRCHPELEAMQRAIQQHNPLRKITIVTFTVLMSKIVSKE